ncbi:glycosyltransferase family 4 protein [Paenibacillus doosanensis]|uniref:glycosyltransferase family 4 protein n=1 Tax=Paenibacillus doosanensis TaxID=1229154 RepID=UPI00218022DA|nr:glycosyltransferase family 4 protein [Paenibacillus doosanensis]MCS7459893.1 glycosyltransferase family 4 protein [Paenibacillus doosanensis]
MKVLILIPSLHEKGPNIVAKSIPQYSRCEEIQYVFLSLRKNTEDLLNVYNKQFLNVTELDMRSIPLPKDINKLKKVIQNINPDVIHAHTFWPTVLCGFFINGYKKIVTIHNNPIEDYTFEYGKIAGRIMTIIFKTALRAYDVLIPISKYVGSAIKGHKKAKIKVIYNGIEDRYQLNSTIVNHNSLNLLTISVLNKRKNVIKILEILKLLKEKDLKVNCKIVGEGAELSDLIEFSRRNGLNEIVSFEGNIPRDSVFDYIRQSDAFIFTSKSEGFGLVVVESLMMGKPVIVSDIPVMWEIVDNNDGFILETDSQFVEAIKTLFNIKLRQQLSQSAREKYLRNFTIEKMVDSYEKIYLEK